MSDRRIVVAHVLGTLEYGGVESMLLGLLSSLPEDVIRSKVFFTGTDKGPRFGDLDSLHDEVIHCPFSPGQRWRNIYRLACALREQKVDAVLGYSFGAHLFMCIAARMAGVRHSLVRVSGSVNGGSGKRWKSALISQLARPFCDAEIAVSETVRRELNQFCRLPLSRIHLIREACDVAKIEAEASEARRRRSGEIIYRLVMIGRLEAAKDHETLLRALRIVRRELHRVQLQIIGEGPNRACIEELVYKLQLGDCVELLGNRKDVPQLLGGADISVLSTNSEGFGIVLVESMAAGTPVIATEVSACCEVLDNGECGVLVPPKDPLALANAILDLIKDAAKRQLFVERAKKRVNELYDLHRAGQLYGELLSGSSKRRVSSTESEIGGQSAEKQVVGLRSKSQERRR